MTDEWVPTVAPLSEPVSGRGMCLPLTLTAEEERNARAARGREHRVHALWHIGNRLAEQQDRGPSLFDLEAEEGDPLDAMRRAWGQWQGLTGAEPDFQLAWCVGALRLLGVRVESNAGAPRVVLGGRKADDVGPVLDLLRLHRPAVVEQLKRGLPFDSIPWQLKLLRQAAGEWPVWGMREGDGPGRESVFPVLLEDVPPFYDALRVCRPDCFRAIPEAAANVLRADPIGRRLPAGTVWVGPAFAEYPDGRGEAMHAELKIRKAHGLAYNAILH